MEKRRKKKRKEKKVKRNKNENESFKIFFFQIFIYMLVGDFRKKITDIFSLGNYKAINEVVKTRNNLDTAGTDS